MNWQSESNGSHVMEFLGLRRSIGIIGISLPFVLVIGNWVLGGSGIESSISRYYYTPMGNVFVGSLCAIGIFLMSYRYDQRNDILSDVSFIFAIGVALFPTAPDNPTSCQAIVGRLHYLSAALLFITFAYFSLVLFEKPDERPNLDMRNTRRVKAYKVCGIVILACIILLGLNGVLRCKGLLPDNSPVNTIKPVFFLESIAVVAFGVSWLAKGGWFPFLRDRVP